ncbi:MAG: 2OG-Fe(II) oxygenase family protein [Caulobacterales bacterium]|nr:2OG-Fe(II) oxygenase family protein [Caulobacterales bacterium]
MTANADLAPELEPLARPIGECVEMIFPTPLAVHHWPDSEALNAALAELILAAEAAADGGGLARSNVGGWHSPLDFLFRPEPCLERLRGRIQRMSGEMTNVVMRPGRQVRYAMEGWANVLRRGQYNSLHVHPNATWSGVYYVTGNRPPEADGSPEFSGKIEFVDPRPGASATYAVENALQRRCLLSPKAGAMILFPAWMQHQVHPFFGPGARISIAFNVTVR